MSATTLRPEGERVVEGQRPAKRERLTPPSRIILQRRAPKVIRRHFRRAIVRFSVLLAGDLAAFLLLRGAIQTIRSDAVGTPLGNLFRTYLPHGYLGGWLFAVAMVLGLIVAGSYGRGDFRRDASRLLAGVTLAAALSLWHHLWLDSAAIVAAQFAVTVLAVWLVLLAERQLVDVLVARYVPRKHRADRFVFVADPDDPENARIYRRLANSKRMIPLGWVNANGNAYPDRDDIVGHVSDFCDILEQTNADTVAICGDFDAREFESVVEASASAGCAVLAMSRHAGIVRTQRLGLAWHGGVPFAQLSVPALKAQQLLVKRVIDIVGALLGLVVLAPVFLLIAAAVRLTSAGPVFFTQERVGFGGKLFRLTKFRTMRVGADDEKQAVAHLNHSSDPRLFKIPNDPRVTKFGAWLRRWSLDELPQLWNVLVGNMSLVGPRPFFEEDLAGYSDHHYARLGARPGITGLWQVNGRSSVVDFEEVVRMDREYIDRWTLWLDLTILARTIPAVVRRTGAY